MHYYRLYIFAAIALLFILADPAHSGELSKKCKKLRRVEAVGIKNSQQYFLKSDQAYSILRNKKKAKKLGYQKYEQCSSTESTLVKRASSSRRCPLVLGIQETKQFLSSKMLKKFRNEEKAILAGYEKWELCPEESDPQELAPPSPDLVIEEGVRHPNVYNSATLKHPDGGYVTYLGVSASSFDQEMLALSTSNDGITWSAPQSIQDLELQLQETFTHAAPYFLEDNSVAVIYQAIRHISSGAVDFFHLERAVSEDLLTFEASPGGMILNEERTETPDVISPSAGILWLYYVRFGELKRAVSEDSGLTWQDQPATVSISGISDNLAPYPSSPDVTLLPSGQYRMYFASPPDTSSLQYKIYSAISDDGLEFLLEDGVVLESDDSETSYSDPDVLLLDDQTIRLYFSERRRTDEGIESQIRSALGLIE